MKYEKEIFNSKNKNVMYKCVKRLFAHLYEVSFEEHNRCPVNVHKRKYLVGPHFLYAFLLKCRYKKNNITFAFYLSLLQPLGAVYFLFPCYVFSENLSWSKKKLVCIVQPNS